MHISELIKRLIHARSILGEVEVYLEDTHGSFGETRLKGVEKTPEGKVVLRVYANDYPYEEITVFSSAVEPPDAGTTE